MTLIDSRPGIAAVWRALSAETGVAIDAEGAVSRLGPPLVDELARWFPPADVATMADRFRALYVPLAVQRTVALPGAHEAIKAVRHHGGRAIVITAKYEPNARAHLDHLGLEVDELIGWRWGPEKAEALRAHDADIYVGDHVSDIAAAKQAGAFALGVSTGPHSADELAVAGADAVLDTLDAFPEWLADFVLDRKLASLDAHLRSLGSVLVAFSGGADSAFLLAAAARSLGAENVVAATAVSPSLPSAELDDAREFARGLGVRHVTPRTDELSRAGYRANSANRCYFCKAELLDVLTPLAAQHGLAHVATGTNHDDAIADFRPGIRAAAERGAVTPLRDAGLTKSEVRVASRRWGLSTWDKPAAACLSSRVAYGLTITPERLARVERAEASLRAIFAAHGLPVRNLRVRDTGDHARVEVDREHVAAVAALAEVRAAVLDAGFSAVQIDSRGFRSGSMNEALALMGQRSSGR